MKTCKTILLLVAVSILPLLMHAQNKWLDSMRLVANTQKEDTSKVWTLAGLADYYMYNDPDSGVIRGKQAVVLANKLNYESGIFWATVSLDHSLFITGNYTEELDYALKALPYAKHLTDPRAYGWSNGIIADSYINLGDYEAALPYIRSILQSMKQQVHNELWSGYAVFVDEFAGLHQYDSALIYGRESLRLLKEQPALFNDKGWDGQMARNQVYYYLGRALEVNEKLDSAVYYYNASLNTLQDVSVQVNVLMAYNGLASIFLKQHKPDSAMLYAKKVLQNKITNAFPSAKLLAANLLGDVYQSAGNADSSLKYLRIAVNLKDKSYNREKTHAFQSSLQKNLDKQRAIAEAAIALKNRYELYVFIAVFIILAIILTFIVKQRRIKQLQSIRNSIAHDLHDDIGSTLSSISIMNELAKAKSPEALPLLTSIGESASAVQENMSDIVWAVNPTNDHFENVLQRMQLFATEILEAKNIQLMFNSDASLNGVRLTMKQRKNLYLFFKEAINNAAKHSGANKISITIFKKDAQIEMLIIDNGNGFDTTEAYDGNGMSSLKKRAEELNAKYQVNSKTNNGTTVQLKFKIT